MIVIKIEMWPAGYESKAFELVRVFIAKQAGGTSKTADYEFAVMRRGETRAPWKHGDGKNETATPLRTGTVKDHARQAYHVLRLVKRGITSMWPEWTNKKEPLDVGDRRGEVPHTVETDDEMDLATEGMEAGLAELGRTYGLNTVEADLRRAADHLLGGSSPKAQCTSCGRKTWGEERICSMPQPNRRACEGAMRPWSANEYQALDKSYLSRKIVGATVNDRYDRAAEVIRHLGNPPADMVEMVVRRIVGESDSFAFIQASIEVIVARLEKEFGIPRHPNLRS